MSTRDVIKKLQDYTHLAWDEKAVTSGTGGTFLKSRTKSSRGNIYYKLSCYDRHQGIYGHESINELIASRLLDNLGISHIPYKLVHALVMVKGQTHETWLSESRDYRRPHERRQALDTYIDPNARGDESPLEFCTKRGWMDAINAMMAFDYLIINRDRHGANIEVILRDGTVELAPLFDHGVSFAFSCYDDEERIRTFDPMADRNANNYIGSRSLERNLELVPSDMLQGSVLSDGGASLFRGLEDAMPDCLREKIWEIVSIRWHHLVDLGIAKECGGQ